MTFDRALVVARQRGLAIWNLTDLGDVWQVNIRADRHEDGRPARYLGFAQAATPAEAAKAALKCKLVHWTNSGKVIDASKREDVV